MIRFLTALALTALAACGTRGPNDCNLSFDREIAFTAAAAQDVVTARALGPSCDRAVGVLTVSSADGHPLWAWSAPMTQAFGDAFTGATSETMQAFLERWSQPTIARTAEAPPWPLTQGARTTLDRLTYEDIRARDLPMLCHLTGTGVETCVFWEPAAAGAGQFFERDLREARRTQP
jgi:hypothetical protein